MSSPMTESSISLVDIGKQIRCCRRRRCYFKDYILFLRARRN